MKKYYLFIIIVICLFAALGIGYSLFYKKHPSSHHAKIKTVTVQLLKYHQIPLSVRAYAKTISPDSVAITAQTNGIISAIKFTPGQQVHAGDVLIVLRSSDVNNQVKKLFAQMKLAKSLYQRLKKQTPGTVSAYDLEQAKLKYQQALSVYKEAESVGNISAPISGKISDTTFTPGSFVQQGDVLAHIITSTRLEISYRLPSSYIDQAKPGQEVTFIPSNSTHAYQGRVNYVAAFFDSNNQLAVRATLVKPQNLLLNQFGKVTQILAPQRKLLAVPQSLVQSDLDGFYVYSIEHHKIVKIYFKPGNITQSGLIEVKAGLKQGMPIVTTDPQTVQVGDTVKVKQ